jgi:hypothetical protein
VPGVTANGIAANITNGSRLDHVPDALDTNQMSTAALQNMESAIDSVISQSRKMDVPSDERDKLSMSPKATNSLSTVPQGIPKLPDPLPQRIQDLVAKLKQVCMIYYQVSIKNVDICF